MGSLEYQSVHCRDILPVLAMPNDNRVKLVSVVIEEREEIEDHG